MTNKEAFVHGIETFCKQAGLDADDAAQMERLLFMPPKAAMPIVKAASVSVSRIKYVKGGQQLHKSAYNVSGLINDLMTKIKDPATWQSLADAAKQQAQTASMGAGAGGAGQPSGPPANTAADGESSGGWWSGIGKAIGSLFGGASGAEEKSKTEPDAAETKLHEEWKQEWESSPLKSSIPLNQYIGLRGQWEGGSQTTPMETFIGGRWAAKRHQLQQREARLAMRGLGIDMAPGELAAMDDATIKQRFTDPAKQYAIMNARNMARTREREQGGVGARMGGGLSTGNQGGQSAMNAADTTPPPSPGASTPPPTSTAPNPSNVPGGAPTRGLMAEAQSYNKTGENPTMINGKMKDSSGVA